MKEKVNLKEAFKKGLAKIFGSLRAMFSLITILILIILTVLPIPFEKVQFIVPYIVGIAGGIIGMRTITDVRNVKNKKTK